MSDPTDEQQIEYWSERARHAEAEIERLRAAAKYCEDNHCDVDEIERLRAALLKEGIRSTERDAAFAEIERLRAANKARDELAASVREETDKALAKAKGSEVQGE